MCSWEWVSRDATEGMSRLCASQGESAREIPFRYNVSANAKLPVFVPDQLPDTVTSDDEAKMKIRPTQIGALFFNKFDHLPHKSAGIVWEVNHTADVECKVNPLKPKLWTLAHVHLTKNKGYVLA